jgi:chromosomal replication initiation ATPase DnaA
MTNPGTIETILRDEILGRVARVLHVPVSELLKPNRGQIRIAEARQIAMYLLFHLNGHSLSRVGDVMARDRTTVRYAVDKVSMDKRLRDTAAHIMVGYKNAVAASNPGSKERVDAPRPGRPSF